MPSPLDIIYWGEASVGILVNVSIVAVIVFWWFQSKRLEIINIILASIGMSRLALILFFVVIFPWVPISDALFAVLSMYVTFCCLWFDTILCVFYCVKICNYNHPFFMYLKLRIFKMVPWMFLMSITASMICSLPFGWLVFTTIINNTTNSTNSTNGGSIIEETNFINQMILYMVGTSVPFCASCLVVSLIINSLWKHTRYMTRDDGGFSNPQLQAHIRAVKSMIFFILLFVIYFVSTNLIYLPSLEENDLALDILNVFSCLYPTFHSIQLVLNNRKMRRIFFQLIPRKIKMTSMETNLTETK